VLSVAVMYADSRFDYLDRVRYGLAYVVTPLYWLADTPARVSDWIDDVLVSHQDLLEEKNQLQEELLLAQRQLQLLASLTSENSRLRALQAASQSVSGQVMTAEIIYISSDSGSRRVLINRGARNGVVNGQALLDAHGLMGQVIEVLPYTSWVMLITDVRHGTPVQVNRNGERAIARGSRSTAPELELEYVPETADIESGDLLVSSGLGQRFPKDYPVAKVTSVHHDPGQPFAVIKARPLAQLDRSRHVMLVISPVELNESELTILASDEMSVLPSTVTKPSADSEPSASSEPLVDGAPVEEPNAQASPAQLKPEE